MSTTSQVTINPGQPAEYQQVLVKPATAPTVSVTLPMHAALVLACLEGGVLTYDSADAGLYWALYNHPRYETYYNLREKQRHEQIRGERTLFDFSSLRAETESLGA